MERDRGAHDCGHVKGRRCAPYCLPSHGSLESGAGQSMALEVSSGDRPGGAEQEAVQQNRF